MIKMLLSDKLKEVLKNNGVEKYQPAYDGESAALDLYYTGESTLLTPYEMGQLLPTGLRVIIPDGYVGLIVERGSITKVPMIQRAGCIDKYTGEVFVNYVNLDNTNSYKTSRVQLNEGAKLPSQLLVIPVLNKFEEVSEDEFKKLAETIKRGEGKTGSSDK